MAYEVIIKTATGTTVETLTSGDIHYLYAGRVDRNFGKVVLQIPIKPGRTINNYTKDMIIEVWREQQGNLVLDGETCYFLRYKSIYRTRDNLELIELRGVDTVYQVDARVIEYDAGSSEASKTDVCNDMMKEFIDENMVSATDTDRNLSSSYFGVQADDGGGGTVSFAGSREYVYTALMDVTDQSREGGDWVTFDVYYNGDLPLEFRTYSGQRGNDLTNLITLSVEAGNLSQPNLIYDWENEKTVAYMAGVGIESQRLVGTAENTSVLAESVWSRREVISQNFQAETEATLDTMAQKLLEQYKGRQIITGTIQQTKGTRYGINWNYGDKLNVSYANAEFECRVLAYEIEYGTNGKGKTVDTITATILGEL